MEGSVLLRELPALLTKHRPAVEQPVWDQSSTFTHLVQAHADILAPLQQQVAVLGQAGEVTLAMWSLHGHSDVTATQICLSLW